MYKIIMSELSEDDRHKPKVLLEYYDLGRFNLDPTENSINNLCFIKISLLIFYHHKIEWLKFFYLNKF